MNLRTPPAYHRCRRDAIEWRAYWQRVLFITLLSSLNSFLSLVEIYLHGRCIRETTVDRRPLFVLGHPRTGTTLLHSLLALDERQLGVCSTFCAGFPSCFLWFERCVFPLQFPPPYATLPILPIPHF